MPEKVVIFGANEAAVLSHFYLTHDSPCEVVAFTVNRDFIKEETLCGLPIIPFENIEAAFPPAEHRMHIAVFYGRVNRTREEKYHQAKAKGYRLISHISSKAVTWPGLVIGDNSVIMESCVVQPYAKIGNNVTISTGSIIGHHSVIGDHCFLAAGAVVLGCATIEPYCFLGGNATIRDGVTVARECIVGAGVLIGKNTQERGVYVSKPPERLSKSSDVLGQWLTSQAR
jgi:sugar O-acyltransferase (sialic acid O-acetyltransferase NeuD family)